MLGCRTLQRVLVLQVEALVVNPVQDHVHAGEVVGGGVHLLSIEAAHVLDLLRHAQQQGAGAAGRVIDVLEAPFPGGDDLGQNGADFLRRVELARLLSRAAGELADEVFVGIAQHVGLGIGQAEVDLVQVAEHLGDEFVFLALGFPKLRRAEIKILEQALEVVLAGVAHGAGLDVLQDGGEVFEDEVVLLSCALFRDLVEELGRFQEVAQPPDGFLLDGGEHRLALLRGFVDLVELDAVVL